MEHHQLDLLSDSKIGFASSGSKQLLMDSNALLKWKSQIAAYQQRARNSRPPLQTTLFDLAPVHSDPDAIDPFSLYLHPMSFYRLPADGPGQACI